MLKKIRCRFHHAFHLVTLASIAPEPSGDFVRLVAALDEPEFYCFDLAGWGDHLQLDDPLQTHTCKKRGGADQMFRFSENPRRGDWV